MPLVRWCPRWLMSQHKLSNAWLPTLQQQLFLQLFDLPCHFCYQLVESLCFHYIAVWSPLTSSLRSWMIRNLWYRTSHMHRLILCNMRQLSTNTSPIPLCPISTHVLLFHLVSLTFLYEIRFLLSTFLLLTVSLTHLYSCRSNLTCLHQCHPPSLS